MIRNNPLTISKNFRPDSHRMECWKRMNSFEHLRFPNPPIRPLKRWRFVVDFQDFFDQIDTEWQLYWQGVYLAHFYPLLRLVFSGYNSRYFTRSRWNYEYACTSSQTTARPQSPRPLRSRIRTPSRWAPPQRSRRTPRIQSGRRKRPLPPTELEHIRRGKLVTAAPGKKGTIIIGASLIN